MKEAIDEEVMVPLWTQILCVPQLLSSVLHELYIQRFSEEIIVHKYTHIQTGGIHQPIFSCSHTLFLPHIRLAFYPSWAAVAACIKALVIAGSNGIWRRWGLPRAGHARPPPWARKAAGWTSPAPPPGCPGSRLGIPCSPTVGWCRKMASVPLAWDPAGVAAAGSTVVEQGLHWSLYWKNPV